jgi:hypothetical protein
LRCAENQQIFAGLEKEGEWQEIKLTEEGARGWMR